MYRYLLALLPLVPALSCAADVVEAKEVASDAVASVSTQAVAEAGAISSINDLLEQAEQFRKDDNTEAYLRTMDQLFELYPNNRDVRQIVGNSWLRMGQWDKVQILIADTKWREVNPDESMKRAANAVRTENLFQAWVILEEAYRSDPENPAVLLNLGSIYCQFNGCDKGIELLRKATEVAPDNFRGFVALARAARAERLPEEGLAAIEKVEELLSESLEQEPRLKAELQQLMLDLIEIQHEAKAEGE